MKRASRDVPPPAGPARLQGPEADARPLFFSGGTALRETSRALARRTRHSVHLLTTFDSGGSSAALRRAFAMPAVGDIRNRLLALADAGAVPAPALEFFSARLPADGDPAELRQELMALGQSAHPVWRAMPEDYARAFRLHLGYFLRRMPPTFDPRLASLGNLLLAGGYLRHKRDLTPPIALFSQLLRVRGTVLPTVEESLHLAAELTDGSLVVGQHRFKALPAPVARLLLTVHEPDRGAENGEPAPASATPCRPRLSPVAAEHVRGADLICYPVGSFYSSVLANLLPSGVGLAVARRACPKVFIPNSGHDAELAGLGVAGQAAALLRTLREDAPWARTEELLDFVLVDSRHGRYEGGLGPGTHEELAALGVRVMDRDMVTEAEPGRHDPEAVAATLLEICGCGA
ncbi:GAK system CofD-like protein [Desulfovibrio sp.]|uniref:GAK system CofD-like protein n=1 Tax=Desulfovibrio sp. TaxID=885 RepID=UPI002630B4A5|nr:GAK system CofD-like protein [Desulfovibrio sp.]